MAWQMSKGRPRSFEEVVAASDPAEMARLANGESFIDPAVEKKFHAEVAVHEDRYGSSEWRVEYFDDDGGCYVTIFAGPSAEQRARDYFAALKAGAIKIVREWPPTH
jgi:hypothetical protein